MSKIKENTVSVMEKFKRETIRIELHFTCVSEEYFYYNLREYYDFLTHKLYKSKVYGVYGKQFYKLKSLSDIQALGLDTDFHYRLPCFICASKIY